MFKSIPFDLIECKKAAKRADETIHIISEKVKAWPGYSSYMYYLTAAPFLYSVLKTLTACKSHVLYLIVVLLKASSHSYSYL